MIIRRLPEVVVALVTLVAPLAALAQATDGSVTTVPLALAPAMGTRVLILLAVVLAGVAAYFLRRASGRVAAVIGFVAVLTGLAGLGYAVPMINMIKVQGSQCGMQTTQMFMPMTPTALKSFCPNAIQIVSIQGAMCYGDSLGPAPVLLAPCSVGQVLADGEECLLSCPT